MHDELVRGAYQHGTYQEFVVCDPKRRSIHKAAVRDRVVQQALFQVLYTIFDPHFIYNSFSSRLSKGTHLGVARLEQAMRQVTSNWQKPAWALKCDVRKFFDSIDHQILKTLLWKSIPDQASQKLVAIVLGSFEKSEGKGLPLGNVTSQLFANIYMNELDQYVKHTLKRKYYFRYADDFVILGNTREELEWILWEVGEFLRHELALELHPDKVEIRKVSQGVDFLGYVIFPHHRRLRTKTRKRVQRKILLPGSVLYKASQLTSYLGVARHAQERVLERAIITKWDQVSPEKE